jgi:tetratricopeptide (TPR) repeat protein
MTNRQSNIIFYSVISIIIYALILNIFYPEIFENLSKSKEEIAIKRAMTSGEYNKALVIYEQLVKERVDDDNEISNETSVMYEKMANIYYLIGNKLEEKNYYLKSLAIKKQLNTSDIFIFAHTYYKLGLIAEEEGQYDQAQMYYEESLFKRLGGATKEKEEQGIITGMHQSRLNYVRLNNEETITTFKKLGSIHNIKKEYATAKNYYERALAASKNTFGEDAPETLEVIRLLKESPI